MATYNYITTLTRTGGDTGAAAIFLDAQLGANPSPASDTNFSTTLTDTRRNIPVNVQSVEAGFPNLTGINTSDTLSVQIGTWFTPTNSFKDAIYTYVSSFDSGDEPPFDTYLSSNEILDTTYLTIAIPVMPVSTPQENCTKEYAQSIYDTIYALWDDDPTGNQNAINQFITYAYNIINNLNPTADITLSASFSSPNTIELTIPSTATILNTYNLGVRCNYIEYTVDNTITEFTWNWNKAVATPQTHSETQTGNYPDGVYKCYTSGIYGILGEGNDEYDAYLANDTRYIFQTENIDAIITGLQDCVNQNDPAQVEAYAEILAQQQIVADLWDAFEGDPEPVNDALAYLQELVDGSGIVCCSGLSMTLGMGTTNQMVLSYPSLTAGTYTNQSGTLTNSLTGEEYTFTGFPANDEDTQLVLTSTTIGAGSSFSDGVWQGVVSYEVDGIPYSCTAYALVVTNARCCVRKAQAKSATCKNLTSKAEELSSWLETAIDEFNYAAYSVSNGFIKKINAVCSSCGCGC